MYNMGRLSTISPDGMFSATASVFLLSEPGLGQLGQVQKRGSYADWDVT
jgi:hypothetical protein